MTLVKPPIYGRDPLGGPGGTTSAPGKWFVDVSPSLRGTEVQDREDEESTHWIPFQELERLRNQRSRQYTPMTTMDGVFNYPLHLLT